MIVNQNPINFEARIVFKKPNCEIKPYVAVDSMANNNMSAGSGKTREPGWLLRLIFGLKKYNKLPGRKVGHENQ